MRSAERCDLPALVRRHVGLGVTTGANPAGKAMTPAAGMCVGRRQHRGRGRAAHRRNTSAVRRDLRALHAPLAATNGALDDENYGPFLAAISVLLDAGAAAKVLKPEIDPKDVLLQLSVLWRIPPGPTPPSNTPPASST
jgi:hypothetical protein